MLLISILSSSNSMSYTNNQCLSIRSISSPYFIIWPQFVLIWSLSKSRAVLVVRSRANLFVWTFHVVLPRISCCPVQNSRLSIDCPIKNLPITNKFRIKPLSVSNSKRKVNFNSWRIVNLPRQNDEDKLYPAAIGHQSIVGWMGLVGRVRSRPPDPRKLRPS